MGNSIYCPCILPWVPHHAWAEAGIDYEKVTFGPPERCPKCGFWPWQFADEQTFEAWVGLVKKEDWRRCLAESEAEIQGQAQEQEKLLRDINEDMAWKIGGTE